MGVSNRIYGNDLFPPECCKKNSVKLPCDTLDNFGTIGSLGAVRLNRESRDSFLESGAVPPL
jgi:hypothetical protein